MIPISDTLMSNGRRKLTSERRKSTG
jgi:ribosome biogenesis protein Tsr3